MKFQVLGIMSGSSLDGLDIAFCEITREKNWSFNIIAAECYSFSEKMVKKLSSSTSLSGFELEKLDQEFTNAVGDLVKRFIQDKSSRNIDFVSLHGHTVFHFPELRFSRQLGKGGALSSALGFPVVCDFRSSDIAVGGQGTPMVAITDKYLFQEYSHLINIGGIANMTLQGETNISFDVCAANQVLNYLAQKIGLQFDESGDAARSAVVHDELLAELSSIGFYARAIPKSLDNSFSREEVIPILDKYDISIEDKLRTYSDHIAMQLANHFAWTGSDAKVLITGGGAYNVYLVEKFQELLSPELSLDVTIPESQIIEYKEALAVAFSGVLRWVNEANFLGAISGAEINTSNGAIYDAKPKSK